MCFGNSQVPKWKREIVKDHKFDSIQIHAFYDSSCLTRMNYFCMYIFILKGFLVNIADLWTAVSLLVIGNSSMNADASIPPEVAKWVFLGAIMISFILLFWEIWKARIHVASRDISYNFFNTIASRWYSVKDYKYFCLFQEINNSRKPIDSIAFFVLFTLKGWKRILFAEAPRQVINIVTLIAVLPKWIQVKDGIIIQNEGLGNTHIQRLMTITMMFSTFIFAISFSLFCCAAIIYIPVLCHIQGNLKEYCCHKVDKRIEELQRKQARKQSVKSNDSGYHTPALKKPQMIIENQYTRPYPAYYSTSYHARINNKRQDSVSSSNSDQQQGLISHAQRFAWTSPYHTSINSASYTHLTPSYYQYSNNPSIYHPHQKQNYF